MSAFDAGKPKGVEVTVTTASSGGFAIGGGGGGVRALDRRLSTTGDRQDDAASPCAGAEERTGSAEGREGEAMSDTLMNEGNRHSTVLDRIMLGHPVELDGDFALRMWRTLGDHVRINRDGTCSVRLQEGGGPDLNDAIRLARLIGGRS